MTVHHAPVVCPYCGYTFDAVSSAQNDGAEIEPGDPSLCVSCGGVMVYGGEPGRLTVRPMTPTEYGAMPAELHDFIRRAQAAIRSRTEPLKSCRAPHE